METTRSRTEAKLQEGRIPEPTKAEVKARQIHPPYKNTKRNYGFRQREVQASPSNDNPGEEDGMEGPMIIKAEMGGHFVHRMYVDGGSSSEILYEHRFNRFRSKRKRRQANEKINSIISHVNRTKRERRTEYLPGGCKRSRQCSPNDRKGWEATERLLKWSFELEEHDIHYRSRTAVKGQILADFIVERPKDDPQDTAMRDKEALPSRPNNYKSRRDGIHICSKIQANYVLREIHEGSCSMHAGPRSVVAKALRSGYYWPTMQADARKLIRECNDCQVHRLVPRSLQQNLVLITSPWPFYKWRIDIAGSFMEGPGKVKFLIVAIDYFTKWIEAKPVATITEAQIKKDNPFKDWREKLCIHQCFTFVKHPQTNGLVERANRILGEGIKARLDERRKNWLEEILHVLWVHRTMIKSNNRETPFLLTYGTEAVYPVEIGMPTLRTMKVDMKKK
uniref:Reverse transcriptase domain-containing protein n=1 Tax=Tanacetum cinerariifolium TaxID=118510 RepID=A0A6L2NMB0_TANCI|nr:reverse transcriptase domain-containing protein [Tanacetum cinerariifolium]